MTLNRGLFVRNIGTVGTTPPEARLALAGLLAENAPGVPRAGLLAQNDAIVVKGTTGMTYDVEVCNPVTTRDEGDGVYLPTFSGAATNVPTIAAPGSGSRWDLIWVKQNDSEKGDANNNAVVGVTHGDASGSPDKPTGDLPDGALVLAEALVATGATATNGASVSITQTWRHTATRGAPITVRNVAERAEITAPAIRQEIYRLDGGKEFWNGTAWVPALTTSPVNTSDAGWTYSSGLTLTTGPGGVKTIVLSLRLTRTGGNIALAGAYTAAFPAAFIPAGFPPVGASAYHYTNVLNSSDIPKINLGVRVKTNGSMDFISLNGSQTINAGDWLYISTSWQN